MLRRRGQLGPFGKVIIGGPIPSPCMMLIVRYLHLTIALSNNSGNNLSRRVRALPPRLIWVFRPDGRSSQIQFAG